MTALCREFARNCEEATKCCQGSELGKTTFFSCYFQRKFMGGEFMQQDPHEKNTQTKGRNGKSAFHRSLSHGHFHLSNILGSVYT